MIRNKVFRRVQIIRLAVGLYRIFKRIQYLKEHGADAAKVEALYACAGRNIREASFRLCGAIVKAGQFLSLRQELFPASFTRELQGLQDRVPPVPFTAIQTSMIRAWKRPLQDIFGWIEEVPIASASLAQVHRAKLADGQTVAVKVLRPGIEQLVAADLSALGLVVRILDRLPALRKRMDFIDLHREFVNTLAKEMDMNVEANHIHRFLKTIGQDTRIVIPEVFDEYTTKRVLVMSYITGANIRDIKQLQAWGVNRRTVRDALLDVYLKQILVNGFVHLDPHPGNLVVQSNGRLAILDFGMVAEYGQAERGAFRQLIQRVILRDAEGVVSVLQQLGYVQSDADTQEFARGIGSMLGRIDLALLRGLLAHESFRMQAKYMLLIRCLGLLKTVLSTLTPEETDWFSVLSEHVMPILLK